MMNTAGSAIRGDGLEPRFELEHVDFGQSPTASTATPAIEIGCATPWQSANAPDRSTEAGSALLVGARRHDWFGVPAAKPLMLVIFSVFLMVYGLRLVTGRLTDVERRWMLAPHPAGRVRGMPWALLGYGLGTLLISLGGLLGPVHHAIGDPLMLSGLGLCTMGLLLHFWTPSRLVPSWLRHDAAPRLAPRPADPGVIAPAPAPGADMPAPVDADLPVYDVEAAASNIR